VLLHAFPLNARMWEGQLAFAEQGWRVIAPQLRGFDDPVGQVFPRPEETGPPNAVRHGETGPPTAVRREETYPASVDDYAGDVIDLLDALHIDGAVIGGLSMGGYIAFAILRHAARYVHGLILADTRSQADTPGDADGRKRMLQLVQDKGPAALAGEMLPKLLGDTTRAAHPEVVEQVRSLILSNSANAIAGAIRALMTRPDSTPLLQTIHFPTLIMVGAEDAVTPPSAAEEMHRAIAGSQLTIIPAAGHLTNLEQPQAFNEALARFLGHRV